MRIWSEATKPSLGEGLEGGKTRPTLSAIPLFPQKGPGAISAGAFLRKERLLNLLLNILEIQFFIIMSKP